MKLFSLSVLVFLYLLFHVALSLGHGHTPGKGRPSPGAPPGSNQHAGTCVAFNPRLKQKAEDFAKMLEQGIIRE